MKLLKKIRQGIRGLDTIEKKSFWTVALITTATGCATLFTAPATYGTNLILAATGLSVLFPVLMMLICGFTQNYRVCYPVLCIGIGAVCLPVTFLANGGFHSGMPIFCAAGTLTSGFCSDKKWRTISFLVSVTATIGTFYLCKKGFQVLCPVNYSWVENDIILAYSMASVALYIGINMILNEARSCEAGEEALGYYLDPRVKEQLVRRANLGTPDSKGAKKRVTVLFADISRFTSITENMDPESAAGYLTTFLEAADEVIHLNNGIVDKYIGDCVMAYWMDPEENGTGILAAVRAVMDLRERLYLDSERIYSEYGAELDFSSGIAYGDVILGDVGSGGRRDYTIIGDTVNTACRLQDLASRGELLVSDTVADYLGEQAKMVPVEETCYLRGKNKALSIYRVVTLKDREETFMPAAFRDTEKIVFGSNDYVLYVCGCRGSYPVSGIRYSSFGGETSCYVLKRNRYAVIIDCGTGLSNAREILGDCEKIDILLTHVHYDHILGLLDSGVFPENVPIRLFGHFGGWVGNQTLDVFLDTPYWPVNMVRLPEVDVIIGKDYELEEGIQAAFYRSDHPDNGCVIRLLAGKKKICIYSDLEDPSYLDPEVAKNCELLFYDGMFDDKDRQKHRGWGHSTWQEAIRYARRENAGRLVVTHHSPDYGDHTLRKLEEQAREMYAGAVFARAGDRYIIHGQ